ncbi:MAG: hypothetical protein A2X23_00300 [Chloroflexi bacterium GWC2_73_18]|nr:MAG: hypothetical protein A2X23_00300 [Chloroflexi bacterium GWC2_73_18]
MGRPLVRLRKEVVFDRLLARLLVVAPGRWVLKGGLALDYRFGARARTTKDVDLAGPDGEDTATEMPLTAQACDPGDFFSFAIERAARLDQLAEGAATRHRAVASLAGRVFEEGAVDVGFDLSPGWQPEILEGPDLLRFAEIEPVRVPALPLELQVAEKVDAYARRYGPSRIASTRVRDLVDLFLIAALAPLDAESLREALRVTFERRGRRTLPAALPRPPADWARPFAQLAGEVGLEPGLRRGHDAAARLLDAILRGGIGHGVWDPAGQAWRRR